MRVIGLTGGIATGKSTVAREFERRGAVIVDADRTARAVVAPGSPALAEIVARFGAAVIGPDGALDRAALGDLVFADATARHDLETITHPRIRLAMAEEIAAAVAQDVPLVVVDIPLLYESDRAGEFEGVLLVYTDPATQRGRLHDRDGLDDVAISRRLDAQLTIDSKRDRATWVIDNSGTLAETLAQINLWWAANIEGRATTGPGEVSGV